MIGLRKQNGSSQGAKRFRPLRLGQVVSNQLDALLMTVRRETQQRATAFAGAIRTTKLSHDSEGRQPRKRFDVVGSLHGIVEVLAHQSQADAADQADQYGQRNVASLGGARWGR